MRLRWIWRWRSLAERDRKWVKMNEENTLAHQIDVVSNTHKKWNKTADSAAMVARIITLVCTKCPNEAKQQYQKRRRWWRPLMTWMAKAHKNKNKYISVCVRASIKSENGLVVASNFIHLLCFCITHCELIHLCTIMCTQITLTTLIINHPNILFFSPIFVCHWRRRWATCCYCTHLCVCLCHVLNTFLHLLVFFFCFIVSLFLCLSTLFAHFSLLFTLLCCAQIVPLSISLTFPISSFTACEILLLWLRVCTLFLCVCVFVSPNPNLRNYPIVAIVVVATEAQRAGAYALKRKRERTCEHFEIKKKVQSD